MNTRHYYKEMSAAFVGWGARLEAVSSLAWGVALIGFDPHASTVVYCGLKPFQVSQPLLSAIVSAQNGLLNMNCASLCATIFCYVIALALLVIFLADAGCIRFYVKTHRYHRCFDIIV